MIENYPIITPSQFRTIVWVDPAISDLIIASAIQTEQITRIYDLLGHIYYNDIVLEVSGNTLSTADSTIYNDYLIYILSWLTANRLFLDMRIPLKENGPRIDDTQTSEDDQKDSVWSVKRNDFQNLANVKIKHMLHYINFHMADYPDYYNWRDGNNRRKFNFVIRGR